MRQEQFFDTGSGRCQEKPSTYFHRLQVFGWTLVFWAVFVTTLFKTITMTDFDTTQLALLGINGGTYLGFKVQEKQS
jgi:hypothetical protein